MIERNVVGSAKDAVDLFIEMEVSGFIPDQFALSRLISDAGVGCSLVNMYVKCAVDGSGDASMRVFDQMLMHDAMSWTAITIGYVKSGGRDMEAIELVMSWTAIITGYVQSGGRDMEAIELFCTMKQEGVRPNQFTFSSVLKACANLSVADLGEQLSQLEYLDLSNNNITGLSSDLWSWGTSLKGLNLSFNQIRGPLSSNIGNFVRVQLLDLLHNAFSGRIPDAFSSLSSLQFLDLSNNMFEGSIPSGLLNCKALVTVDLSANHLNGGLPSGFGDAFPNLSCLNLAWISIHGRISDLSGLKHVKHLYLSRNLFWGPFMGVPQMPLQDTYQRTSRPWAVRQLYDKEGSTTSGSLQTDWTSWVTDEKVATSIPAVIFSKPLLNCTFVDVFVSNIALQPGDVVIRCSIRARLQGNFAWWNPSCHQVPVHGSMVTDEEAARELERLGRTRHQNLLALIGYCLAGDKRIAIYEHMENGNLEILLYDQPPGSRHMENQGMGEAEDGESVWKIAQFALSSWAFRHMILLGVARALAFLHHGCSPPIIHECVKLSSIYLGAGLEPKLSDFGLAKIVGYSLKNDPLMGVTPAYTPPEFLDQIETPSVTLKSDVFGFGVVLFELVTGRKPEGDGYPDRQQAIRIAICTPLSDRLHLKIEIFVTRESEPVLEDGKLYKSQSCCDPPMTRGSGSMSGIFLFGGPAILLWHLWETRVSARPQDMNGDDVKEGPTTDTEQKMQTEESQSDLSSMLTLQYGSRPKFQTIFDSIGDQWGKCVVGVFVCGPLSLQTSVAAECRSNGTVYHFINHSFEL
ncbi:hypothetical protein ACLOJK_020611 [Asimina triloba]